MNKKIITASLAVLALTGGAFSVSAEEMPVYSLDAIVVTANRTPEKQIDSNANVSVVTAKEIEQKHYNDVDQAIKNIPGVFISNHGAGSQSYNSDQVYINGSKNVVILVDGMRKNTNGNTLTNSNISEMVAMDSIDHIEVLKGSASTLYGSDAQGGVINIITKKPKKMVSKPLFVLPLVMQTEKNIPFTMKAKKDRSFGMQKSAKNLREILKMVGDVKLSIISMPNIMM